MSNTQRMRRVHVQPHQAVVFALLANGAYLLSEDGDNEEYDRAIVELIGNTLGMPADERPALLTLMAALK